MKELFIDLETYSPVDLGKTGVYPYAESPEFFEIYNTEQYEFHAGMEANMDYFSTLLHHRGKPSDCDR